MIPVFTAESIRKWEKQTIENQNISPLELMERAAKKCFEWIHNFVTKDSRIHIFCGKGNNGGDGFALARILFEQGHNVHTYYIDTKGNFSEECKVNKNRLESISSIQHIQKVDDLPSISPKDYVIDAIYGIGIRDTILGLEATVINHINASGAEIISIDIPSGIHIDKIHDGIAVVATQTLTFQSPKLSFLVPGTAEYVGKWHVLDIGLDDAFIDQEKTNSWMLDKESVRRLIKPHSKFSHKGIFGHALLITGSLGKIGASILCAKACIRSGTGLVSAYVPSCGYLPLQTAVPEVMVIPFPDVNNITKEPEDLTPYKSIGIGPGLGTKPETIRALSNLYKSCKLPMVLDADALNILSKSPEQWHFISNSTILTPHIGEFERLTSPSNSPFERLEKLKKLCIDRKSHIILKGAYTAICTPEGGICFNPTGNVGMATAGAGDVLTGILTGLLSQGYTPLHACQLGVYLHGLAADIAAKKTGTHSLIASDIINHLGEAYLSLLIEETN